MGDTTDKPKKRGRPPSDRNRYTPALGQSICDALSAGETLKAICKNGKKSGMPSATTVRRWALDPDHAFSAMYNAARVLGLHGMVDDLLTIADDAKDDFLPGKTADGRKVPDEKAISRARLQIDTRKWLLSKLLPRQFGDKVEMTGKDGGPIAMEHSGMTDLEAARRMVLILVEQITGEGGSQGDALKLLNGISPDDEAANQPQ
jgi:hypothetical protein